MAKSTNICPISRQSWKLTLFLIGPLDLKMATTLRLLRVSDRLVESSKSRLRQVVNNSCLLPNNKSTLSVDCGRGEIGGGEETIDREDRKI
jgi:hypothetical protein